MEGEKEPVTTEAGEEADLNSLQQGLAKANVLQWKATHPDQSLDNIIASATAVTGRYDDSLAEKGIDKTLYDQWRFVKFKSKPKTLATAGSDSVRKPMTIILPDRSSRPTRESVARKEGLQIEKRVAPEGGKPMSPISEQSPSTEGFKSYKGDEAVLSEAGVLKNGDVTGAGNEEAAEGASSEDSPRKSVQKTEVDVASYKAKIAKLKQNLTAFNKEKENLPKIERVEFQKVEFELPPYEPGGLKTESSVFSLDSDQKTEAETSQGGPKTVNSTGDNEREVTAERSNKDKMEDLRKNMEKFSQEKEARVLEKVIAPSVGMINSEKISKSSKVDSKNEKLVISETKKEDNLKQEIQQKSGANSVAKGSKDKKNIKTKDNESKNESVVKDEEIKKTKSDADEAKGGLEKGYAKSIMNKLISDSQTRVVEKRIKVIIDDSLPEIDEKDDDEEAKIERPSDNAKQAVKEGSAREMVDRWKANEIIRSSGDARVRVEIKEEDGTVSESTPEVRDGVVRAEETVGEVTVEKGTTRGLLDQWQNKPHSSVVGKKQILISEEDGKVAENEPITRKDVVRGSDVTDESSVEKGSTRNLLFSWQNRKEKEAVKKKIEINEDDGRCAENDPVEKPGVVRAVDKVEYDNSVTKGKTGQLLEQWQQQGTGGSGGSSRDKSPLLISEGDGKVLENQPEVVDMAREGDEVDASLSSVQRGMARNLKEQWQKMDQDRNYKKGKVVISEDDGTVVENEPIQLEDLARESDLSNDTHVVNKGLTRSLLSQWQSEAPDAQQWGQTVTAEVKGGSTKILLNQWTLKNTQPFQANKMNIVMNEDDGYVAENTPETRGAEVVKSSDVGDETRGEMGHTQKAKEQLQIECEKRQQSRKEMIKLWDEGADHKSVAENEPEQRSDICREEDFATEVVATRGFARNMVGKWGQQKGVGRKEVRLEYAEGPAVFENEPAPSLKYDKHRAGSHGVFENQPILREDVTREVDVAPEVIPASVTRNAKRMWFQKEKEASNPAPSRRRVEMVRFTPERERTPPS